MSVVRPNDRATTAGDSTLPRDADKDTRGLAAGIAGRAPRKQISILQHRADFLRAARALRRGEPGFLLQARRRAPEEADPTSIRLGFTCSKKIGNAVARNRAKRRLREIARVVMPEAGHPGWDYVIVGRPGVTVDRDFALMTCDLHRALRATHRMQEAQE